MTLIDADFSNNIVAQHPEPMLFDTEQLSRWQGIDIGYFSGMDYEDCRHIWADHPCISLLTQGSAKGVIFSGKQVVEVDVQPGVIGIFGPAFEVHRSVWECTNVKRVIIDLTPDAYEIAGLQDERLSSIVQNLQAEDTSLGLLIQAMLNEIQAGSPHGSLYAETLTSGFLRYIHQRYGIKQSNSANPHQRLSKMHLDRVLSFIRENLGSDISLKEMSEISGVSRALFTQQFRNTTGLSPYQYLIHSRIRYARRLLLQNSMPQVDIALLTGFSNHAHFCTTFRSVMGVTPIKFREHCTK